MTPKTTRRGFLAGAAGAGAGLLSQRLHAAIPPVRIPLAVKERDIIVKGRAAKVFGIVMPNGAPGLVMNEGETFSVELTNALGEPTLVHWHGQTPPSDQDGTPMLSQEPIAAGGMHVYDFPARSGTHWMHSHVGLQEQKLLAAPLIVKSRAEIEEDMQEHVVMLHDFTFRDPQEILDELKAGGGGHAMHHHGMVNDIMYDAYLANDRTLDDPEVVKVERGGRIRLRIINAAASSNMWIDLGGLSGDLVAADGNPVAPLTASRFALAVAQRADLVIALPNEEGAWPVLFQPEGAAERTGIILATASGTIPRVADMADMAPAVTLDQELQLRAASPLRPEPVTRTEIVKLTGGGKDYLWGLNGKSDMHAALFTVKLGDRIAVALHNETTMSHPMHLHGHHFQVMSVNGTVFPGAMRDTVLVPPDATVIIVFDAENPGNWAFHCHHLYHMNAGMMGAIGYTSAA
ncbi:MAG: multicopper oxidase family protein [Parvibaculaceae bacterium]